ncbi:class I SAM-dependent methyltransferase [Catellatospora sp. NPDC049609]|uniref:class I SAM-dependent methyltransferase n=1 Tax=Catellatospora sp. NPDC049609 TaxID=3155505 RepID=UPI003444E716
MTPPTATVPQNLRLIGGEMLVWTDDDASADRQPVAGPALQEMLRDLTRPGGRALVAGPHDDALLTLLAAAMRVTCLVRAYPDAEAVAARHPGVTVLCGSVAKLDPGDRYDLVVACDGLDRLPSVEGGALSWAETAELVAGAVAPGGTLLLAQENLLGVHRIVRMSPWYGERTDADWTPVGEYDASRPASPAELVARLAGLGLTVAEPMAGFPTAREPSVLAPLDRLADPHLSGFVRIAVAAAYGAQLAGRPVLSDPRALAGSALRAGSAAALAPVWLVAATRAGALIPRQRVVVADADAVRHPVRYEVVRGEHGWTRRVLGDATRISRDGVYRDPAALAGPLPRGRLFEEQLIELCLRRALPELSRVLTRYAGWLADRAGADGTVSGVALWAAPGDLLGDGDGFTPWDPTWSTTLREPVAVALARSLRSFAVRLITGGYSHPWPVLVDADSLTVILAGMAGHTLERPTLTAAVALEARLRAAELGLDEQGREELHERLAAVMPGTPPLDLDSHRELHAANERLRAELAHAVARTAWAEELLGKRESALRNAEDRLDMLSGSLSFRIGRLVIYPLRQAKALAKRLVRR